MTRELEANCYPLTLIRKNKARVNLITNQGLVRRREDEVVAVASIPYVHAWDQRGYIKDNGSSRNQDRRKDHATQVEGDEISKR